MNFRWCGSTATCWQFVISSTYLSFFSWLPTLKCSTFLTNIVKQCRSSDEKFSATFVYAECMLLSVDSEIAVPYVARRSRNRANMEFSNAEKYFRRSAGLNEPEMDGFIQQLEYRFENHRSIKSNLHRILPTHCVTRSTVIIIKQCVKFNCQDHDDTVDNDRVQHLAR